MEEGSISVITSLQRVALDLGTKCTQILTQISFIFCGVCVISGCHGMVTAGPFGRHTCKAESDHSDEMELNKDISIEDKISSVSMGGGPKRKMRSHENVTNTGRNEE